MDDAYATTEAREMPEPTNEIIACGFSAAQETRIAPAASGFLAWRASLSTRGAAMQLEYV
jgi:hypothetical protein